MNKLPIRQSWFNELDTANIQRGYFWLRQISSSIERIVSFGCWSSEPFALLWILDAGEISVVEIKEENLSCPKENLEVLTKKVPEALQERSVDFITADMTGKIEKLICHHYDLAFCRNTLYMIWPNIQKLQSAINEMVRITKPGGWVIAVEPQVVEQSEEIAIFIPGIELPFKREIPKGETKDISLYFENAGLVRCQLEETPDWTYCYRKSYS